MDLHCTASAAPDRDAESPAAVAVKPTSAGKASYPHPDAAVRMARALESLPKIAGAFGEGRLSYSKVRALTRVATAETEDTLLNIALNGTAAHVERTVRGFRRAVRYLERDEAEAMHERRYLDCRRESDGSVRLEARLAPEVGEMLLKALEAAHAQLEERAGDAEGAGAAAADAAAVPADVSAETSRTKSALPACWDAGSENVSAETTLPSPATPARPTARDGSRRSMPRASGLLMPTPRVAVGVASVWTMTSPLTGCAGGRGMADGVALGPWGISLSVAVVQACCWPATLSSQRRCSCSIFRLVV